METAARFYPSPPPEGTPASPCSPSPIPAVRVSSPRPTRFLPLPQRRRRPSAAPRGSSWCGAVWRVACVRPPLALSLSLSASSFLALLASWLRLHWAETERNTELRSRIERRRGRTRPPPPPLAEAGCGDDGARSRPRVSTGRRGGREAAVTPVGDSPLVPAACQHLRRKRKEKEREAVGQWIVAG